MNSLLGWIERFVTLALPLPMIQWRENINEYGQYQQVPEKAGVVKNQATLFDIN